MSNIRQSIEIQVVTGGILLALTLPPVPAPAVAITVVNHSFEAVDTLPVGGIWPEADVDPVNADAWWEPGPVDGSMGAFPPGLIPPGFSPPVGATLDTGIFYNTPVTQDPDTGQLVSNPSYVINADGDQLAYLFAKDDLQPPIGFIQHLAAAYEAGEAYVMTVGVGKSFFLPPFGGSQGDPALGLRLLYLDTQETAHIVAETTVAVGTVFSTSLSDFAVVTASVDNTDPWHGRPMAIEILPVDGDSGAWIFDNVRVALVPEPAWSVVALAPVLLGPWGRRSALRAGRSGGRA